MNSESLTGDRLRFIDDRHGISFESVLARRRVSFSLIFQSKRETRERPTHRV